MNAANVRWRALWSVQFALFVLLATALLAGILPAGVVVDRWLSRELEERAWRDVAFAPAILADRSRAIADAMMMHAKELAHSPQLVDALVLRDRARASRVADEVARALQARPVVVGADGVVWEGPAPLQSLIEATQRGEMPVAVVSDSASMYLVSLAPVEHGGVWTGAAGLLTPMDPAEAGALAALTRSDLVLLLGSTSTAAVQSSDVAAAAAIARAVAAEASPNGPREVTVDGTRYLVATGPLAGATVAFVRDLRRELAILPELRRILVICGVAALLVAMILGVRLALLIVHPVRTLATAADRLSAGDFHAPLTRSRVRELRRVTDAFDGMRSALALRIDQLGAANRLLEERQARLAALQAELIRRERVEASGRIAVELAHEIRNPVANLRNCLELLHRRLGADPEGREYASLAIDELLRMHELAERMLDLNRPRASGSAPCDAVALVREVAALTRLGGDGAVTAVNVRAQGHAPAAIPAESLKQVLLNLVQNAREAKPDGLVLDIDVVSDGAFTSMTVADNGPGVPADIRTVVFDPFFTTRGSSGGLGLGLFVVESLIRGHGGSIRVDAPDDGTGACFSIMLPAALVPRDVRAARIAPA